MLADREEVWRKAHARRACAIALTAMLSVAGCGGGGGTGLPGGSVGHPHEPAGMTVGVDEPFTLTPVGQPVTGWYVESNPENVSVVNDDNAPKSPGSVLRLKFPQGFGGGNAPMLINWNEPGGFPPNDGVLYLQFWVRISADWTNNGNGMTKFLWPRAGTTTNHFVPLNFYTDELRMGFALQGAYLNGIDTDFVQSGSAARGGWHMVELVLNQGSSASADNGSVKVWVDGNQVVSVTGVKMLPDGQALGWDFLAINPTYGGGSNPVPHDQYIYLDHIYASVK